MKRYRGFIAPFLVFVWALLSIPFDTGHAQSSESSSSKPAESTASGQPASGARPVLYKPPLRGAPTDRIGGGTRGVSPDEMPSIMVLAPDHPGLTTRPEPTLYWYISKPTSKPIEFKLHDEQTGNTLFTTTLPSPEVAGIQRISLADLKVDLATGKDYRWLVGVVVDPRQPSREIFSSGKIRKVDEPTYPTDRMQTSDKVLAVAWYAGEGIWYDALEEISAAIEAEPADRDLRTVRASLFEQVGLDEVAKFDMSH